MVSSHIASTSTKEWNKEPSSALQPACQWTPSSIGVIGARSDNSQYVLWWSNVRGQPCPHCILCSGTVGYDRHRFPVYHQMEIPHQPSQVKSPSVRLQSYSYHHLDNQKTKWKQSKKTFTMASIGLQHCARTAEHPTTWPILFLCSKPAGNKIWMPSTHHSLTAIY